jgi:hypothetical protein
MFSRSNFIRLILFIPPCFLFRTFFSRRYRQEENERRIMLQALLGRSKSPKAALAVEDKGLQEAAERGQESGDFGEDIGAQMETEEQEGAQPTVKRKRDKKEKETNRAKEKEMRGDINLLHGETIQVTTGILLSNGVKSQEGQEEDEDETTMQIEAYRLLPYQETPFGLLPPEMVLQIFNLFLDDLPFLVCNIGLTCRYWSDVASSNPCAFATHLPPPPKIHFLCPFCSPSPTLTLRLSRAVWKRVVELDNFRGVLSWTSPDPAAVAATKPAAAPPETTEDGLYKELYCKYHVRMRGT